MTNLACMKNYFILFILCFHQTFAGEIDDKTVVLPARPKMWYTFSLSDVRLLPGSPFYQAMKTDQQYMLGMDVDRMLNNQRRSAGLPQKGPYPGSFQPEGTRPGDLNHYISAISLMYAQTGDDRFLERVTYIINALKEIQDRVDARTRLGDTTVKNRLYAAWQKILGGRLELSGPDEGGYPWGGTTGNDWYGIHKVMAAYRDAYLYCNNQTALQLLISRAGPVTAFVLKANPDLFDGLLDIEHGGMNEVFADLYAITGEQRYMDVSKKFNHQKVILNIADGKDVLYGRHANMQVPTFVGTARQYQLSGDEVSRKATENFLRMIYADHMSAIGGSSRYERYGLPGATTKELGYTADETCITYNMLKVALNYFESTGDLHQMDYFERALYNHILASQDRESGGVTYYTSLMPGSFKAFSKGYDLTGVWCCVGTGMENHAKYGEAIYFHNNKDLFVNLFIPSQLNWEEKGLQVAMETRFPEEDFITLTIKENKSFHDLIYLRYPVWTKRSARAWINGQPVQIEAQPGDYIRLQHPWKAGDVVKIEMPQDFHLEAAKDDPSMVAIFHGPLAMAGELGTTGMPGPDLVQHALFQYRNWSPPTADIPLLVVNKVDLDSWLQPMPDKPLHYKTVQAGWLNGKIKDLSLIPYYNMRHQRYTVYWKLYSREELALRSQVVSDEINPANPPSEKGHNLQGEKLDTSSFKDGRDFWENNRPGRLAKEGGWFSYDMKVTKKDRHYLVVTYWGSTPGNHVFDILVGKQLLQTEDLTERRPLTYYEQVYELPDEPVKAKEKITVTFRAKPGSWAGAVYGLRITSDPKQFPNYLFY